MSTSSYSLIFVFSVSFEFISTAIEDDFFVCVAAVDERKLYCDIDDDDLHSCDICTLHFIQQQLFNII